VPKCPVSDRPSAFRRAWTPDNKKAGSRLPLFVKKVCRPELSVYHLVFPRTCAGEKHIDPLRFPQKTSEIRTAPKGTSFASQCGAKPQMPKNPQVFWQLKQASRLPPADPGHKKRADI